MDFPVVNVDLAAVVAPYAAMSANSYSTTPGAPFDLKCLGWMRVDESGVESKTPAKNSPITGLTVDLYRKTNGQMGVVFRGTDSKIDWISGNFSIPLSLQYKSAFKFFREIHDKYRDDIRFVAGHSLGGGIAMGVSLRYGVDAYVFNPSPRVFDGLGDIHRPASRIAVYQEGDPLNEVWKYSTKMGHLISESKVDIYKVDFKISRSNPHSIETMARSLVIEGGNRSMNLPCLLRP